MTDRIASHILINGLIRRVQSEGGFAIVLHKGDRISGGIVVQIVQNGTTTQLLEQVRDLDGGFTLMPVATKYSGDDTNMSQYIDKRCKSDPDLWVLELDVADGARLAAETLTQC